MRYSLSWISSKSRSRWSFDSSILIPFSYFNLFILDNLIYHIITFYLFLRLNFSFPHLPLRLFTNSPRLPLLFQPIMQLNQILFCICIGQYISMMLSKRSFSIPHQRLFYFLVINLFMCYLL